MMALFDSRESSSPGLMIKSLSVSSFPVALFVCQFRQS